MKVTVWYFNADDTENSPSRDFLMGYHWLLSSNSLHKPPNVVNNPDWKNELRKTHTELMELGASTEDEDSPENIFEYLQAENYNRKGVWNKWIKEHNISHTSISIGDILVYDDEKFLMVDMIGFIDLKTGKKPV